MGCSSSDIFLIKVETLTNTEDFGFGCLVGNSQGGPSPEDDGKNYLDHIVNTSSSYACETGTDIDFISYSCQASLIENYYPTVNAYGEIEDKEIYYNFITNQNSLDINSSIYLCDGCCPEGGSATGEFQLLRINGITVKNSSSCSVQLGSPAGCDGGGNALPFCFVPSLITQFGLGFCSDLYVFMIGDQSVTVNPQECTKHQFQKNDSEYCGWGGDLSKINVNERLSKEVTVSLLIPIAKESINKKINIYENNLAQNSEGLNCGVGKNACYGFPAPNQGYSFDTILPFTNSNIADVAAQKWRVRVAEKESVLKNDLYQKYTLYAYYYASENPDTTVSPCCNSCECFDGTIVKQQDITLTYNNSPSNRKGEYILSSDYMEFDNFAYSGPAKNLYYCSKRID